MTFLQSIILGIVEGLTEYLPVSSTGHLYLATKLLGIGGSNQAAANAYSICIQLGAILAVVSLYPQRIKLIAKGLVGSNKDGRRLGANILVAFIPAAVAGLLFEGVMKKHLFGLWPISVAWIVGGVLILAVSGRWVNPATAKSGCKLEELSLKQAALIGCAQCMALWPGVSRSLATILGAVFIGVSLSAAVEFSFLLGLVTLGTATLYEGIKEGHQMIATFGWLTPLIGLVTAYLSAFIAVKWMVSYINRRGMIGFGYYRLAIGCLTIVMLVTYWR